MNTANTTLASALKRGDADAYRTLVRELGTPLWRYAVKITADAALAEDIVQDVLLQVYKKRKSLDEHGEIRGLCFRITRNFARNALRDHARRTRREQEAGVMQRGHNQDDAERLDNVRTQVAALPDELREVVDLRFEFGLSRAEIASALELPEGTVATRQRTALQQVRDRLALSGPVLAAPDLKAALSTSLRQTSSDPSPSFIPQLEEMVMTQLKLAKLKLAGMACAVCALLIGLAVGAAAMSGSNATGTSADAPDKTAHADTGANRAETQRDTTINNGTADPDLSADRPDDIPAVDDPAIPAGQTPDQPAKADDDETKAGQASEEPAGGDDDITPVPAPEAIAPYFVSEAPARVRVLEAYRYDVVLQGEPLPELKVVESPDWLILTEFTLAGVPTEDDIGRSAEIVLVAHNSAGESEQRFHINVDAPPTITSTAPADGAVGTLYSYTIETKGWPEPELNVTDAPSWLTLEGNVLSGTPEADDAGEYGPFTIKASNGVEPAATQEVAIAVNGPPSFVSEPVLRAKAGEAYSYTVKLAGFPTPVLTGRRLPKWLRLDGDTLRGTPRNEDIGRTGNISLTASNGHRPEAKQSFRIEVEANPAYIELPWTADDMREYLKFGMKWHLKEYVQLPGAGRMHGMDHEYEVTDITEEGFTVTVTVTWVLRGMLAEPPVVTTHTYTWENALEFALSEMRQYADWERETSQETITVLGKRRKCVVHKVTGEDTTPDGENVLLTHKWYFCAELPFIAVKVESVTDYHKRKEREKIPGDKILDKVEGAGK